MEPLKSFHGRAVLLPVENIDTDQIIPARFLKTTDKQGLAANLFYDWRYDAKGNPRPEFVLNQPAAKGAAFLVAGNNFGCGSSREHAPWALQGFGFRAVISTDFADIFKNNSLKNGFLPITVDAATHREILESLSRNGNAELSVDLATQTLTLPSGSAVEFPIDPFSKLCLLNGVDELGYLLRHEEQIREYETAYAV
jgi:3-isopropylmalate/(R)-2-methylmalate dehydratase small subunit